MPEGLVHISYQSWQYSKKNLN